MGQRNGGGTEEREAGRRLDRDIFARIAAFVFLATALLFAMPTFVDAWRLVAAAPAVDDMTQCERRYEKVRAKLGDGEVLGYLTEPTPEEFPADSVLGQLRDRHARAIARYLRTGEFPEHDGIDRSVVRAAADQRHLLLTDDGAPDDEKIRAALTQRLAQILYTSRFARARYVLAPHLNPDAAQTHRILGDFAGTTFDYRGLARRRGLAITDELGDGLVLLRPERRP